MPTYTVHPMLAGLGRCVMRVQRDQAARTEYVLLHMAAAGALSWRDHRLHMFDHPIIPASDGEIVASLVHRGLLEENPDGPVNLVTVTEVGRRALADWSSDEGPDDDLVCAGIRPLTLAMVTLIGLAAWAFLVCLVWSVLRSWS